MNRPDPDRCVYGRTLFAGATTYRGGVTGVTVVTVVMVNMANMVNIRAV